MTSDDAYLCYIKDPPFDPEKWVRAALLAGMRPELREDGRLAVEVLEEADQLDVRLLMGWLTDHYDELALYLVESDYPIT